MRKPVAILFALFLSACSAVQGVENAESAVTRFHASYDQAQFAQIYSAASPALREVSSQQDFLKFMGAVHRKLGKVKDTARTGSHVNVHTSTGLRVTLVYHTNFERGAADEQFVWQVKGDSAQLVGYNINSPALVVN